MIPADTISPAAKVEALLSGMTRDDVYRMSPEMALRFAKALRRIADIADPPKPEPPASGILGDLDRGDRAS